MFRGLPGTQVLTVSESVQGPLPHLPRRPIAPRGALIELRFIAREPPTPDESTSPLNMGNHRHATPD